jgi:hypothetical protein
MTLSKEQGVHARVGKLKADPNGGTVVQAYIFEKEKFSMDEAQAWVKDHKKSSRKDIQRRVIESPTRMDYTDQKNPKIEGHAAVFNQRTELWSGFWEQVSPGAFADALRSDDIYALWNHDPSSVLGNTGSKTLILSEDNIGLRYEIMPPDTTLGKDLTTLIKRGDVRKASFGFNIEDEKIEKLADGKGVMRTILKVKPLFDISPVTYPAYQQTDAHVRMLDAGNEIAYLFEDSGEVIEIPKEVITVKENTSQESDDDLFKRLENLRKTL